MRQTFPTPGILGCRVADRIRSLQRLRREQTLHLIARHERDVRACGISAPGATVRPGVEVRVTAGGMRDHSGPHQSHAPMVNEAPMPRRKDLESVLIIGSGPIVIGQACEFD